MTPPASLLPTCPIPCFNEDAPSSTGKRIAVARGPVVLSCQRKLSDSEPGQTADRVLLGATVAALKDGSAAQGPGERLERGQVSLRTLDSPPVPQSHPTLPTGGQKEKGCVSYSSKFLTLTLETFQAGLDQSCLFPSLPSCFSFHFQTRPGPH